MSRHPGLASAALVAVAAACGGDMAGDDDSPDAGGNDGAVSCIAVVSFEPMTAQAPATIVARSDVFNASGVLTYAWTVKKNGADVPFTALDADSRDIQFDAATAGVYQVDLSVGLDCQAFHGDFNVQQPGANTRVVRLRMVPPTAIAAPPQERTIIVPGGADYAAGILTLDAGNPYPVQVRDGAAAPVAGYLRFTSRATPDAVVEAFSDTSGSASVRLVAGRYDVLVVPSSSALAPRVVLDWDPALGQLLVDSGTALGGSVLDAAGAPVAGARVSLMSGTVPSTVATTAADGSFSLRWREGSAIEKITVVPPSASDLPRLDAQVELGALAAVTIRHASVPISDVGNTLIRVGGAAAVSTDVLVDLSRASCGTVRDGTTVLAQAIGSHRRTLRTDAAGRLPASRFVDGTGAAFIHSTGPGARVALALPLGATVDAAAVVTISGRVLRSGGTARADARLRATLTGPLAHTGAPIPTATAAADGRFTIALAAGADYAITIVDPTADDATLDIDLAGVGTQDLGDLGLPAALTVSGEIRASGQSVGARAVGLAALCHLACTGIERSRPLGEAVTDPAGRFVVAVPDPGVSQ